jgi:prolipoprotein diacylglyceryltransferase
VPFRHKDGNVLLSHPTQIYESLFHLTMACVLVQIIRLDVLKRQRLKLYLIAYGVYRFLTEFIRPEEPWLLGLTAYQWGSLALIVGLSIQWRIDRSFSRERSASAGAALAGVSRLNERSLPLSGAALVPYDSDGPLRNGASGHVGESLF